MEKLLPIKFFEKRKVDEQLTEAGGSKDMPKWVMQGDDLTQRSQHLAGSMTQVAASFEAHKKAAHELPLVMATTITEKALAKTHRSTVVDLLNSDSQLNVIGIESIFPNGLYDSSNASYSNGIRPALVLRSDALVDDEFNIIS